MNYRLTWRGLRDTRIAQIAPLTEETVPPKLYGGIERVVSFLTEELVSMGHEVTLFASGDSGPRAKLTAGWPRALRFEASIRDTIAPHMVMIEQSPAAPTSSMWCTVIWTTGRFRCSAG